MRKALLVLVVVTLFLVGCANKGQVSSEEMAGDAVMIISVTDGSSTVVFRLNGSTPAKSLYGMLPLDVEVGDYLSNEKIFYPPVKVDPTDGITGSGDAGDLALFSPWGNVVMYTGPFGSYPGLFLLGTAESGVEMIGNLKGTIHVDRVQ